MTHVLVVRLDNIGDVLLAGPAIRAVAAQADQVTLWCGPNGAAAGRLLPGVGAVLEHRAAWIDPAARGLDREATMRLVDRLAAMAVDRAVILTSFHQSPLPTALLLRLAGVPTIAAISDDHPGGLLDVRHRVDDDVHEVERALSLVATLGYRLPAGDSGALAVALADRAREVLAPPAHDGNGTGPGVATTSATRRVVVHPGASVSARAWRPDGYREVTAQLVAHGWDVAVTGGPDETDLTATVAGSAPGSARDLGGRTDLADLARLLRDSDAVITGNTGPAHLAAAVGTPVVSLYAPTVPASRWRPWGVRHALLGDQAIACAGCRADDCPLPGHPCLDDVSAADVVAALRTVLADKDHRPPPLVAAQVLT